MSGHGDQLRGETRSIHNIGCDLRSLAMGFDRVGNVAVYEELMIYAEDLIKKAIVIDDIYTNIINERLKDANAFNGKMLSVLLHMNDENENK